MALPSLPAQGTNPWYVPRTAWDNAVEAELEGRLSAEGIRDAIQDSTDTVSFNSYSGADPTGSTPSDTAWTALLADVPSGTKIVLDGNYLFLDTLKNNGKELHVEAYGSQIVRGNVTASFDEELVIWTGSYGTINLVSSISVAPATSSGPLTTTLNLSASALDLSIGDVVRVVADNFVPASRVNTARAAFTAVVASVSGSTVVVYGGPYSGDPFTTNIRVARVIPLSGSWRGGSVRRQLADVVPAQGGAMFALRDMVSPSISDVLIPLSSGAGFQLSGCYGADLDNLQINLLRDTWNDTGSSGSVLGYHVLETNSFGTRLRNSRFYGGRHGFSTAQSSPAAGGDATNTTMRAFGVTEYAIVQNVQVEGTYVAAFDTHEASRGVTFDNCVAVGSGYTGFSLRGRNHQINDSQIIDSNVGIRIFDDAFGGESYGHQISDVLIDNPRLYAIEVDVHRLTGHPLVGIRQAIGQNNFTADNVTIKNAKYSPIKLTNARTGKLDISVTWSDTPQASSAIVEATNSEVKGGTVHDESRLITSNPAALVKFPVAGDTSIVELDHARILGTTAQVDRILSSASSSATAILPSILLDEQPTGAAAASTFSASSVIDFKTLSGQTDSGRIGLTASTADLDILAQSLRPILTVQATITTARNLPNLPAGRVQGQILHVFNRPSTGTTGQSTANLTIVQGNGPRTYLIGAANKVLAPGTSCTLQWDVTIGRWCELS